MRRIALLTALLVVAARVMSAAGQTLPPVDVPSIEDPFFDDGGLHEIRILINSKDWQALKDHYLENTYYPCEFQWRNEAVRNVGIRSRGTGSRSDAKPGLRVDFDRYSAGQRFLGLKSFVLRNDTQDPSSMHERLSMRLFRRMGLPAPRVAHTRLYVNDEYAGLYTIVEAIDRKFLKRTFDEDDGHLFEFSSPKDATPYFFEQRGSDPTSYVPLPFKPQTHEDDPRPEFIVRMVDAINETSADVFRSAIAEFLDLEQFVRHIAVETFVAENDGLLGDYGMNNFYFYRFENTSLFRFIAWDKSGAFRGGVRYDIFHNIADVPSWLQNRLMERVIRYPDLHQLYLDALLECARVAGEPEAESADGSGWLEREIQREYDQIRDAALADLQKPYTNDDFERAVDELRVFARERGSAVADQVGRAQALAPRE